MGEYRKRPWDEINNMQGFYVFLISSTINHLKNDIECVKVKKCIRSCSNE